MCDRLLILGGAFDPPHNGHLAIAEAARAALNADKVLFLPTGSPPHKQPAAPPRHRLNMTRLAAAPPFAVSDFELRSNAPSYTVATARALSRFTRPTFIIGADEAAGLPRWKDAAKLFRLCAFAVLPRDGADTSQIRDALISRYNADITIIPMPPVPVSSTALRRKLAAREDVSALIPWDVELYIAREGLYGGGWLGGVLRRLTSALKPRRLNHAMAVTEEAAKLAARHGEDVRKARVAALLHDCAKNLTDAEILRLCAHEPLDASILAKPNLAHSFAGAILARHLYGVTDQDVLAAIRSHTFGRPGMSTLEQIIFVADYIEPTRDASLSPEYAAALQIASPLAYENLPQAAAVILRDCIAHEESRGRPVHPLSLQALESLS